MVSRYWPTSGPLKHRVRQLLSRAVQVAILVCAVSAPYTPTRFEEPQEAWPVRLPDGREAYAMIVPRGGGADVMWHLDVRIQGGRTAGSWEDAVRVAEGFRLALMQEPQRRM